MRSHKWMSEVRLKFRQSVFVQKFSPQKKAPQAGHRPSFFRHSFLLLRHNTNHVWKNTKIASLSGYLNWHRANRPVDF
jgi:hypothetical protein